MVRCKCIQVRSVSTCGCYWSSIEAMFHKAERCRQSFIGQVAVPQDRVKKVFETKDYAFPTTSIMGSTRWVKLPLNSFLQVCVVEDLLVPTADVVHEFFFAGYEVCAVVRPNYGCGAPARAKPFNSHHAATRVQARDHLEVDGTSREAGKKKAPSFLSRSFDRYKERSEIFNARVRKRGFFESESFLRVDLTSLDSMFRLFVFDRLCIGKQLFPGWFSV